MPTVRIDDEVYEWLKSQARPFEDTPNSVLRRVAGLDGTLEKDKGQGGLALKTASMRRDAVGTSRVRTASGRQLLAREGMSAKSAYYHHEGTWFQRVTEFPTILFDRYGYVRFSTEREYLRHPKIHGSEKTNVPDGIASFPEYRKMKRPAF